MENYISLILTQKKSDFFKQREKRDANFKKQVNTIKRRECIPLKTDKIIVKFPNLTRIQLNRAWHRRS